MSLTELGFIDEFQEPLYGFYKLSLSCPVAYDCKTIQFSIWKGSLKEKLIIRENGGKRFDLGDAVRVSYHLKDGEFPILDDIYHTLINQCPNCGSAKGVFDPLRMECDECCRLPVADYPEHLHNQPMRLISCASKEYLFSTGYRIELFPMTLQRLAEALPSCRFPSFVCVISPKHSVHAKIPNLKVGNVYKVCGWKEENLLRISDIC